MTRHFIDIKDHTSTALKELIKLAGRLKQARLGQSKGAPDQPSVLSGETLAMIFEKPSTRTRVSFEMAMHQLGGHCMALQQGNMQLGRGESIKDTAKVMSRYVDLLAVRANNHQTLLDLAEHGSLPVINALTNRSHPCQVMADMLTIHEKKGRVSGLKIAWVGDGNNMTTSFIEAAVRFGFELKIATPSSFAPPDNIINWARSAGGKIYVFDQADSAVTGADVVVTDTWASMGDNKSKESLDCFKPFQVNDHLMAKADAHAIFMHCLPAHRGDEVTDSVMDGPQSVIYDEAENRLHMQKAIIRWVLEHE